MNQLFFTLYIISAIFWLTIIIYLIWKIINLSNSILKEPNKPESNNFFDTTITPILTFNLLKQLINHIIFGSKEAEILKQYKYYFPKPINISYLFELNKPPISLKEFLYGDKK